MGRSQTFYLHGSHALKETWKRVLNTVLIAVVQLFVDSSDFSFTVSNMRAIGQDRVLLDIWMSSSGKVICVVNSSALLPEEILFQETNNNRFYFRSNTPSVQEFSVDFRPAVELKLFCKAVNLLSPESPVLYYQSEPFYASCRSADSL